jgi:Protein of unknown function (DUF2783)
MPELKLITDNRFPDPDAAFRLIVEAHRGLTEDESKALNAKLVLLLANHIGEILVVQKAVELAKR